MRVAITGADGQLGTALIERYADCEVHPLTHASCDVADRGAVERALSAIRPELVINAAAYTDVNGAETRPAIAFASNALGARWVAQAADRVGAGVVYVSTDYVFPGDDGGAPYDEWWPPRALSVYGRSKLAGEAETLRHARRSWIVRSSWIYGGPGKFVDQILAAARTRDNITVVADEIGGPTYVVDLAGALRALVEQDAPGIYHLANAGECSRAELASAIVEIAGLPARVLPVSGAEYWAGKSGVAPRPANSTLANNAAAALGVTLRPWREALADYLCASR